MWNLTLKGCWSFQWSFKPVGLRNADSNIYARRCFINLTNEMFPKKDVEMFWGSTKNWIYSTKSGHEVVELANETAHPSSSTLAPIENHLCQQLWKPKALTKIKHFLWKVMSGAFSSKKTSSTVNGFTCEFSMWKLQWGSRINCACAVLLSCG